VSRELAPTEPMETPGWSRTHFKGVRVGTAGVRGGSKPNYKAVPKGVCPLVRTALVHGSPDWIRTRKPPISIPEWVVPERVTRCQFVPSRAWWRRCLCRLVSSCPGRCRAVR
jgi:hypothetical protein